jgi:dienelactone hydrolase
VSIPEPFRSDPDEPLSTLFLERPAPAALAGVRCLRFELSSRGDRVNGRLLLPADPGRHPLVLVGHGAGGSCDAPPMDAIAGPWVRAGAAVAAIDLPLHGERRSAKLSERVLAALAAGDASGGGLAFDFAAQALVDLQRALDALAEHPEVDASRTVYAGFSLGSVLGALFCAREPRVRAAAFAVGGAGLAPAPLDPAHHVGRIAPRPVLFVNATRDERIPRARAEAFHAAAAEPKQVLWFESGHADLPGRALKAMWGFLVPHLAPPAR